MSDDDDEIAKQLFSTDSESGSPSVTDILTSRRTIQTRGSTRSKLSFQERLFHATSSVVGRIDLSPSTSIKQSKSQITSSKLSQIQHIHDKCTKPDPEIMKIFIDDTSDIQLQTRKLNHAQFWLTHQPGLIFFANEIAEENAHLLDIYSDACKEKDRKIDRLEVEVHSIHSENSKLRDTILTLTKEKERAVFEKYIVEERFNAVAKKDTDGQDDTITVNELRIELKLSEVSRQYEEMRSSKAREELTSHQQQLAYLERELIDAKLKLAQISEEREYVSKVLTYYESHLKTCTPDIIISKKDLQNLNDESFHHKLNKRRKANQIIPYSYTMDALSKFAKRLSHSRILSPASSNSSEDTDMSSISCPPMSQSHVSQRGTSGRNLSYTASHVKSMTASNFLRSPSNLQLLNIRASTSP